MTTAHDLIIGNPFGNVFPQRARDVAKLPREDPRTIALRMLALYISELTFYRPGGLEIGAQSIPLRIPLERIYVEQPDDDVDMVLPCMVFTQTGNEDYQSIGLNSDLDEASRDKYGYGTILQIQYDHVETLTLEVWTNKKPERRCLIAGLQTAMVPTEAMYGVRFRMPDYYDQPVVFTLNKTNRPDDQAIRGRRIAKLEFEMRFEVVNLVNYLPIQPIITVTAMDPADPNFFTTTVGG